MSWLFFHRLHNRVWLFIEKVCKGAPPSIHNQFGMLHSGKRGTQQLSSLGQTEQSPAVATGTLARPVRCVYVRNSDTAGACLLCTLPKIQMAKTLAEICKDVQVSCTVSKCPLAKENYLVLPCSESDYSYQLRETDFTGISSAPRGKLVCIRGQLSMEVSLSRPLAFSMHCQ